MSPLPRRWNEGYVAAFHAEHQGITERILTRCRWQGIDPYRWCAAALGPDDGRTLDLACGSGPMSAHVSGWVGLDRSPEELAAATTLGRGPVARAAMERLPVPTGSADAVVCTMALQVVDDLPGALAEIGRVVRPRGRVSVLLPASGPLGISDARFYLRLQTALRHRIEYPNTAALRAKPLRALVAAAGLEVSSVERQPFALPLRTEAEADELLASLYLPGVDPARLVAAQNLARSRVRREVTVPLRRIVLARAVAR